MTLVKNSFSILGLVVLVACGGGGDSPATSATQVPAAPVQPSVTTPTTTAPTPVAPTAPVTVTPPVAQPPAVVRPPAVVIPPVVAPPAVVIPPITNSPPVTAAPPAVVAPPASSGFRTINASILNACPKLNAVITTEWSNCLAGGKFVGTPAFGAGTCELQVSADGSFTYVDNSGTYRTPSRAQRDPNLTTGGYAFDADFTGTIFIATMYISSPIVNDSSSLWVVDITITFPSTEASELGLGNRKSAALSFTAPGVGAKACKLTGF